MLDHSKVATLWFFGYSCAMGSLFYAFTNPENAFLPTIMALFGISILVTENIKAKSRWGKVLHGINLAFVWPIAIMFSIRGVAKLGNYNDSSSMNEYISLAVLIGIITVYVCTLATVFSEIWEINKARFRTKYPSIPAELEGNHVAIIVSGIFLTSIGIIAHISS